MHLPLETSKHEDLSIGLPAGSMALASRLKSGRAVAMRKCFEWNSIETHESLTLVANDE